MVVRARWSRLLRGGVSLPLFALSLALSLAVSLTSWGQAGPSSPAGARWGLDALASFRALDAERASVRLQIMATVVDEAVESAAWPTLRYHVGDEYLYPASAVKHLAVFAMFSLWPSLAPDDELRIHEAPPPSLTDDELRAFRGRVVRTVRVDDVVRAALVTSENDAYNRVVDVVGHEALNRWLWDAGLRSSRLRHRLFAFVPDSIQRMSPAVEVVRSGSVVEALEARRSGLVFPSEDPTEVLVGDAWVDEETRAVVRSPMNFADKNAVPIEDLHRAMLGFAYPGSSGSASIALPTGARDYLIGVMSTRPEGRPDRGFVERADRYKPLLPGLRRAGISDRVTYVSKGGRAYGFHTETAWVRDPSTRRAVVLTVGLYVNPNGVLNDDRYDYPRSYALFSELGVWIASLLSGRDSL